MKRTNLGELVAAIHTIENFMRDAEADREEVTDNCSGLPCEGDCADCPIEGDLCIQDLLSAMFGERSETKPPEKKGNGAYMNIKGERCYTIPTPDDFVKDDENMTVEGSYVVTVHKQEEVGGFYILKPVARHGFGSEEPDEDAIKWCIMRYNGEAATVDYEYGLTL